MSTTTQENVFLLLEVIERRKENRPEGRTELTKLKTATVLIKQYFFLESAVKSENITQH